MTKYYIETDNGHVVPIWGHSVIAYSYDVEHTVYEFNKNIESWKVFSEEVKNHPLRIGVNYFALLGPEKPKFTRQNLFGSGYEDLSTRCIRQTWAEDDND